MTNEERDIITQFIERVSGAKQGGGGFSSVPGTQPALPPVDREADGLIGDLFTRYPEARYRLTQTAFVQEHALVAAQSRIKQLEAELQQAQQAAQSAQHAPAGGGGFFSNLFGGGAGARPVQPQGAWGQPGQQQYAPSPPPPQYPPGYAPPQQMFQRQGSGFLGSALTTAAGVAGGLVAGNALMNLFSGGHGAAASALPGSGADSPWGSPPALPDAAVDPGFVDQGNWSTDQDFAQSNSGSTGGDWGGGDQQASWSDPASDAGWSDPGGDAGWSDNTDT